MRFVKSLLIIPFVALAACNPNYDMPGMFNGSSVRADERFEQSMQYNEKAGYAHVIVPEDYRVYAITDSHVDSTTRNLQQFVKAYKADFNCPFAIHLGDLINAKDNYPQFFAAMAVEPDEPVTGKVLGDTVFYTPGNHDLYFNLWEVYKAYIPTSTYWFDTRTADGKLLDLYICLDSGEGTLGVKPIKWLKDILAEKSEVGYRHIIVFTHTHMFKQDDSQGHSSNYSMEETYDIAALLTRHGVDMYWSGHDHCREVTKYGNVTYIVVDASEDPDPNPFYMIVNMSSHITYDFISLKQP